MPRNRPPVQHAAVPRPALAKAPAQQAATREKTAPQATRPTQEQPLGTPAQSRALRAAEGETTFAHGKPIPGRASVVLAEARVEAMRQDAAAADVEVRMLPVVVPAQHAVSAPERNAPQRLLLAGLVLAAVLLVGAALTRIRALNGFVFVARAAPVLMLVAANLIAAVAISYLVVAVG